jgi:quinolinate synthase
MKQVDKYRAKYPSARVIVHPECRWEAGQKADRSAQRKDFLKTTDLFVKRTLKKHMRSKQGLKGMCRETQ